MDLSDAVDRGITVTEIAAMDQPIDVSPETTAAFVGRALRGPLNTPVLLHNFGEFRRRFGDSWSRSALGPAVKQFFEHGGRNVWIVRVANNARGALLCLPASGSALVLRAQEPGSTEHVRAAVDYDGIAEENDEMFNLTLQRVDPVDGRVLDQELFRRLSFREEADNFVADVLSTSSMVRVEAPFPTHRPDATTSPDSRYELTWIDHVQEGTDGTELSDYDLIGSQRDRTGLFALEQVDAFDLLYLPPTGKHRDAGPAALLVAEQYCREREAMLIVDPRLDWDSADAAIAGIRSLGLASPNMLSYYPRVVHRDEPETERAIGGAIAGLLCKCDRTLGPWFDIEYAALVRGFRPAVELEDYELSALSRAGLNAIVDGAAGRSGLRASMTMARGSETHRLFTSLAVRRLVLRVVDTIDRATRWAVFQQPDAKLAERVRSRIHAYLCAMADLGAFEDNHFLVQCDVCPAAPDRGVTVLLSFVPRGVEETVALTLHQSASGCRVASTAFGFVAEDCA